MQPGKIWFTSWLSQGARRLTFCPLLRSPPVYLLHSLRAHPPFPPPYPRHASRITNNVTLSRQINKQDKHLYPLHSSCCLSGIFLLLISWNRLTLPLHSQIVLESDINHDGLLDFPEFSQYLQAHEKRLWLMFHSVDRNNDGACRWGSETFCVPLALGWDQNSWNSVSVSFQVGSTLGRSSTCCISSEWRSPLSRPPGSCRGAVCTLLWSVY